MKKVIFYNDDLGEALFKIIDRQNTYTGKAKAHPEDQDLASALTGLTIAEYRARIDREKKKSSAAKAELKKLESQVAEYQKYIAERDARAGELESELNGFIEAKEEFQKALRKIREKNKAE